MKSKEFGLGRRSVLLSTASLLALSAVGVRSAQAETQAQQQAAQPQASGFPPRQKPSSFSVDQIMEQLQKPQGG